MSPSYSASSAPGSRSPNAARSAPSDTPDRHALSPPSHRTTHTRSSANERATAQAHDRSPPYSPADRSTREVRKHFDGDGFDRISRTHGASVTPNRRVTSRIMLKVSRGNCPTAPSSGPRQPGGPIAPRPAGRSCSRRCDRRVAHPNPASAVGPERRRCGLPAPAARLEISGQSTPRRSASIERASRRSAIASGETTCARCSSSSRAPSPVPVPGARGSTTHSNPKNSHPTGNHHPHRRNNSTTSHRSSRTADSEG